MASVRKKVDLAICFVFGLFLGCGVITYLNLWSIDSTLSSYDHDLLRRQFDRANMEAMDESDEWRMKFDAAAARARRADEELGQMKTSLDGAHAKLVGLAKENTFLHDQVISMEKEIHFKNLNCSSLGVDEPELESPSSKCTPSRQ